MEKEKYEISNCEIYLYPKNLYLKMFTGKDSRLPETVKTILGYFDINNAIERLLPQKEKQVICLRYKEGLSYQETSNVLRLDLGKIVELEKSAFEKLNYDVYTQQHKRYIDSKTQTKTKEQIELENIKIAEEKEKDLARWKAINEHFRIQVQKYVEYLQTGVNTQPFNVCFLRQKIDILSLPDREYGLLNEVGVRTVSQLIEFVYIQTNWDKRPYRMGKKSKETIIKRLDSFGLRSDETVRNYDLRILERDCTNDSIKVASSLPTFRYEKKVLIKKSKPTEPLDYPINLYNALFGEKQNPPLPCNKYINSIDKKEKNAVRIEKSINTLKALEKQVILLRFKERLTLSEVGALISKSSARVGQIEAVAIRKLRHPSRIKIIDGHEPEKEKYSLTAEQFKIQKQAYFDYLRNGSVGVLPALDVSIEELNLTSRAYNCLKRSGINTVVELIILICSNDNWQENVRNLGKISKQEILRKLDEYPCERSDYYE